MIVGGVLANHLIFITLDSLLNKGQQDHVIVMWANWSPLAGML